MIGRYSSRYFHEIRARVATMIETAFQEWRYYPGIFVARVISVIVVIVEIELTFRVILELLGANPYSPFVGWVYSFTGDLTSPFVGAFSSVPLGGISVLDLVTILAMVIYAILGWVVIRLVSFVFFGSRGML
jgi:hypothetical protein